MLKIIKLYEALKKIEMKRTTIRDISKTEPDGNDKTLSSLNLQLYDV